MKKEAGLCWRAGKEGREVGEVEERCERSAGQREVVSHAHVLTEPRVYHNYTTANRNFPRGGIICKPPSLLWTDLQEY
eukprot:3877157-Rhodomonas_salina.1